MLNIIYLDSVYLLRKGNHMEQKTKTIIWNQLGAAIDSLGKAIDHTPKEHWEDDTAYHQIWYMAFHTIFWLDYYLTLPTEKYAPPEPFTMSEMDPAGIIPDPAYTKEQLKTYLAYCRKKTHKLIMDLSEGQGALLCKTSKADLPLEEMFLYVMRHTQHHTAQINLLLRQKIDSTSGWTFRAEG